MTNQSNSPLSPAVFVFIISVILFLAFGCGRPDPPLRSVLVFSKTAAFRHGSIAEGKRMFLNLAAEQGFTVDTTEDASVFNPDSLAQYNVVVFLNTTGDVLNPDQQRELERFTAAGGSWLGIHAAADCEYRWPWYHRLVGAYFKNHPAVQSAAIDVVNGDHPATEHLNPRWTRTDEWYNYRDIRHDDIEVVLKLDETSYEGGENGGDHPVAWHHPIGNGRAFYTGLGHTPESYREPQFVAHVAGALEYLFGEGRPVDYESVPAAPEANRFPAETLVQGLTEPMELELLPDGRPLWIQRRGEVMVYDPDFGMAAEVNKLDVWTKFEDGLLGLALDPAFADNQWVYLYYSPNIPESLNRLSRFRWTDRKSVV